ncbi:MAG: NUDIX hydrolase [Synergistales bacterium]|nr:NUDIX hydrolase [Synergistales bacterium]
MFLFKGKYLDLIREDHWEYVKRNNCSGIVVIVPMTRDGKVVFVEQFRRPVAAQVIEWPAGLGNDKAAHDAGTMEAAARRELLEETGYEAEHLAFLVEGPVSSGLSSEIITFYQALDVVKKEGPLGGYALGIGILVLHGPKHGRIIDIKKLRNPAPGFPENHFLGGSRAFDYV